ncbi:MAG TPA: aromatic acid decarboxylase [Gammaproteobacteria bacterium]|nr:aromatic acid decarboxylase [Gammaproteobacteria bacterium]
MSESTTTKTIALALTGASGMQYALRLLECLLDTQCTVYLLISKPARIVLKMDMDISLPARADAAQTYFCKRLNANPKQLRVFGQDEWTAPVASGSAAPDSLVVCPCTTGTLSAIASGNCNSLIERAADVVLKERKQLIVMPREMPLSAIHLENMLKLARMGAVIMPPNPGFYNKPETLDDIIDFVVARILDQLGIKQSLAPAWGLEH